MVAHLLRRVVLGATLGLLGPILPAQAVIQGEVSRNPNGARAFVVRIESTQGEICSGTLIAPDLVLTAAHCVMHQAGYSVVTVDRAFRQRHQRPAAWRSRASARARPMTGSSLPSRASFVRSRLNWSRSGVFDGVSTRPSSAPLPTTFVTC